MGVTTQTIRGERQLRELITVARGEILRTYSRDSCIASTRILIELLEAQRAPARALVVRCAVLNRAAHEMMRRGTPEPGSEEWLAAGGWGLGIGYPGEQLPGRWVGHLVAILEERVLVDLSLDQANRPARGIELAPLIAQVDAKFLRGRRPIMGDFGETFVRYEADPNNRSYEVSRDWHMPERHGPTISRICRRLDLPVPRSARRALEALA